MKKLFSLFLIASLMIFPLRFGIMTLQSAQNLSEHSPETLVEKFAPQISLNKEWLDQERISAHNKFSYIRRPIHNRSDHEVLIFTLFLFFSLYLGKLLYCCKPPVISSSSTIYFLRAPPAASY